MPVPVMHELDDTQKGLLFAIVDRGAGREALPAHLNRVQVTNHLRSVGLIRETDNGRLRPTSCGTMVASLIREIDELNAEAKGEAVYLMANPPHPAVHVSDEPEVVVGVLGGDCPLSRRWRAGVGRYWWHAAASAREDFPDCMGMIQPMPRLGVVVSLPADLSDKLTSAERTLNSGDLDSLADLVRAAREKGTK